MGIDDLLKQATKLSLDAKFNVKVDNGEVRILNYMELGTFLITNEIEMIEIKLKE